MARRRVPPIDADEARPGLYIDLEGSRDAPSLLGVVYLDDTTGHLVTAQHITESALHAAAVLDDATVPSDLVTAVGKVVRRARTEHCRVFAWSEYEAMVLQGLLDGDDALIVDLIVNARAVAERWLRQAHPGHDLFRLPRGQRNRLAHYQQLVGYRRRIDDPDHQPAAGISDLRTALTAANGAVAQLPPEAVVAWRRTLDRNYDDCAGMRAVMLHATADQSAR